MDRCLYRIWFDFCRNFQKLKRLVQLGITQVKTIFSFFLVLAFIPESALARDIATQVLWRLETGQTIYTKPALDGEMLYVGGEKGELRGIDKSSGEVKWTYLANAGIGSGAGFDEARVYVISRDGIVHGIEKTTGKGIWTFQTGGEKQWDYWDVFLSTPVADDQHWIYFGSGDHNVYSINKRSGVLKWKVQTGAIVHGDPVLSGEKLIVGGFDGKMYAIDRADGKVLWTFKTVGNSYFRAGEIPGSATVSDGIVYFGSRDYNLYAVLEETGTGAWNERTPAWVVAKPLVVGGDVYVAISDSARVFSFDANSGRKKWQTELPLNVFGGAEALGASHIAVPGLDGRIHFVNRKTGAIDGFHDTAESVRHRGDFFDDEGSLQQKSIRSWEDLFTQYDDYFSELGGIAGGLVVDGDIIYYATGAGGIASVKVTGIDGKGAEQKN